MIKNQLLKQSLLAGLSGCLLALSWHNFIFPGIAFWPGLIAFVALIPLMVAWQQSSWQRNFYLAWLAGILYFLGVLFWLRTLSGDTNVDNNIAWLIFSFLGGVYFGLWGATTSFVHTRLKWPSCLILALGWAGWEYIRGQIITGGWPWGSLGHTQYANPITRQFAAVAGVTGLSFIIVMVNCWILALVKAVVKKQIKIIKMEEIILKIKEKIKNKQIMVFFVAFFIFFWIFLLFININEMIRYQHLTKAPVKVALIQANIDTKQVWDADYKDAALKKMKRMHRQAADDNPYLIVWAESSFPGILEYEPYVKWENELRSLIKSVGIPTLLTSNEYVPTYNLEGKKYHRYNSAFLLGGKGETLGRYRKIKLVPGGEYLPWNWLRRFMRTVVREPILQDFEPGSSYQPLNIGRLRFSPLICYEDHFEELGVQLAKHDNHFFVATANNGWSKDPWMGIQHTTMAVFLAIEHRMAIVKADMTGPTCIIDSWGHMSETLPYYQEAILKSTIEVANFTSFFTKFGNIVPFSLTIIFFLMIFISFLKINND